MLFFWSVAGQVDAASGLCALGLLFCYGSFCFFLGGVDLGSLCLGFLRQTVVSLNISSVDIAGRCPGLALWSHSQCSADIEVWGD